MTEVVEYLDKERFLVFLRQAFKFRNVVETFRAI